MSSSLSSIILIGVVWLLIVTTLFARRHSPVRRTSKVLSETRVVHEGGTGIIRTRRRPLPAESLYHSDPDSEIELVDAEPEQVVIDDTREPVVPSVVDGDVVAYRTLDDHDTGEFAPVSAGDLPDATVSEDPEVAAGDAAAGTAAPGTTDGDYGDDAADRGFGHDTETTTEIHPVAGDADGDTAAGTVGLSDAGAARELRTVAPVPDPTPASAVDAAEETTVEPAPRFTEVSQAYVRGGDIDVSVGTDDELPSDGDAGLSRDTGDGTDDDRHDDGADTDLPVGDTDGGELTAEDLDFLASRKGRGIYDPVASQELAEQRLRRRRRVLWGLAAVTLFSLVGAVVVSGALWAVVVLAVALTAVYLYTLRKQTVAEQELQRRRLARMRRARLGVRNTDDRELGVPDRLRRPGAVVVETDDADPAFADLGYADVTFAGYDDRATGGAEDSPVYHDGHPDEGPLSVRVV